MTAFRKKFLSAFLGNLLEHYDTAIFGFLSPFLAPLIFPKQDPITALIWTWAMIPLGMVVRPLGSLIFGYMGDRYGRKQALFFSLAGMAVVSGCFAMTPLYSKIGIAAAILFCLWRVLQNFFAAGETMGGAIYIFEGAPENRHDILSSLYSSSTLGGMLIASAGVTLLSHFQIIDWGWRFLYVLGCSTAIFGFFIRRQIDASPVEPRIPLLEVLRQNKKPLILIAIVSGFAYANYMIALVIMNGFAPLVTSVTKEQMAGINTALLIFDFSILPFFGWLSSKITRERMMFLAASSVALGGIFLLGLVQGASLAGVVAIRICLVTLGVAFCAPFHAWAQNLVPPAHRYTIISLGYALGSQLLGGHTAPLSLWLYRETGIVSSVAWYWVFLALASLTALHFAKERQTIKEIS